MRGSFARSTAKLAESETSAANARCDANGLTEERVEQRIEHAIKDPREGESVEQEPVQSAGDVIADLVKKENPIWQTTHDKRGHQDENDFEHSHLTLSPLILIAANVANN